MKIDTRNEFCDAVALNTGAAGTYNVGNQIPLGVPRDIGVGTPLYLVISVAVGITVASTTGTVQFQLASDDAAALATTGQTVHFVTPAFATSTTPIAAGTVLAIVALPMEGNAYEEFLGIQQITGATALNAGAINAFLTTDVAKWKAYDAVTS